MSNQAKPTTVSNGDIFPRDSITLDEGLKRGMNLTQIRLYNSRNNPLLSIPSTNRPEDLTPELNERLTKEMEDYARPILQLAGITVNTTPSYFEKFNSMKAVETTDYLHRPLTPLPAPISPPPLQLADRESISDQTTNEDHNSSIKIEITSPKDFNYGGIENELHYVTCTCHGKNFPIIFDDNSKRTD